MVLKVENCRTCKDVLQEYRAHPERHAMPLTAEQEMAMLRDWHAAGHPDLNAAARRL